MTSYLRFLAEGSNSEDLIGPIPESSTDRNGSDIADQGNNRTWVFYALIALGGVVVALIIGFGIYYVYSWFQMRKRKEEFAHDPEKQIKHKELDLFDKNKINNWIINDTGLNHVDEVETKHISIFTEMFIKLDFKQAVSQTKTIVSARPIQSKHETCYFEVEIESIVKGVEVVVGLISEKEYAQNQLPGITKNSFGFYSKGGKVMLNGKELYSANIQGEFGDTFGIGYTFESGKIWIFHNGVFLNELDPENVNAAKDPYEFMKQKQDRSEWDKKMKEYVAKQINAEKKYPYHVVIGTTGPCSLLLNIGGGMFRNFNKEIAQGLIY